MSEKSITRTTLAEAKLADRRIDWDRFDAVEDDGEIDFDWDSAVVVQRPVKEPVSIRLDDDVLAYFKADGRGYQSRINSVLRSYMQAKTARS